MDKFSELKAAAMAATPGPWILDDDSWSEGDNANVSTEERYDGRIVSIAQVEGGGSESGFDEPFSTEQQANARYITAANPAVVLELLAELERYKQYAKERDAENESLALTVGRLRVELEAKDQAHRVHAARLISERGVLRERVTELEAKLATPVRLPALLQPERDAVNEMIFANGRNEAIAECSVAIRQAGFLSEASPMTIEGDE
ncbi:ead/Ea22-like family protein [Serratia marcescens]|nr:ead/Ea22-like family protein [Serratia marcescens]